MVMHFTREEEEFSHLFIETGIKRNAAIVLAVLATIPEATSREIMRCTNLRQPEISIAMRYLGNKGWVESRRGHGEHESKGRPVKFYRLAKPITEIIDLIDKERMRKADHQLQLIRKLRDCSF